MRGRGRALTHTTRPESSHQNYYTTEPALSADTCQLLLTKDTPAHKHLKGTQLIESIGAG